MNNGLKVTLVSGAVIVVLAGCIWALRGYSHVRDLRHEYAELAAANAALKEKVRGQGEQAAKLENAVSKANAGIRRDEADWSKLVAANEAKQKAWEKLLNENPELQKKQLVAYRAGVMSQYGPFFYKMGLAAEQRRQLENALVQRRCDNEDLDAILKGTPIHSDKADPAWQKAKKDVEATFVSAATAVLGERGYQQFEQFERDRFLWTYAGSFAAAASRAGIPMSLQQVEQLVDTIAGCPNRQQMAGGLSGLPSTEADWDAIDALSEKFLSKEQFDMFRSATFGNSNVDRFENRYNYERNRAMEELRQKELEKNRSAR